MTKLKKCKKCGTYTLKEEIKNSLNHSPQRRQMNEKCKCGGKISDAHYKFVKVRDAPKSNINFVRKN
jgi:rRNA maturation protein Nop10